MGERKLGLYKNTLQRNQALKAALLLLLTSCGSNPTEERVAGSFLLDKLNIGVIYAGEAVTVPVLRERIRVDTGAISCISNTYSTNQGNAVDVICEYPIVESKSSEISSETKNTPNLDTKTENQASASVAMTEDQLEFARKLGITTCALGTLAPVSVAALLIANSYKTHKVEKERIARMEQKRLENQQTIIRRKKAIEEKRQRFEIGKLTRDKLVANLASDLIFGFKECDFRFIRDSINSDLKEMGQGPLTNGEFEFVYKHMGEKPNLDSRALVGAYRRSPTIKHDETKHKNKNNNSGRENDSDNQGGPDGWGGGGNSGGGGGGGHGGPGGGGSGRGPDRSGGGFGLDTMKKKFNVPLPDEMKAFIVAAHETVHKCQHARGEKLKPSNQQTELEYLEDKYEEQAWNEALDALKGQYPSVHGAIRVGSASTGYKTFSIPNTSSY